MSLSLSVTVSLFRCCAYYFVTYPVVCRLLFLPLDLIHCISWYFVFILIFIMIAEQVYLLLYFYFFNLQTVSSMSSKLIIMLYY